MPLKVHMDRNSMKFYNKDLALKWTRHIELWKIASLNSVITNKNTMNSYQSMKLKCLIPAELLKKKLLICPTWSIEWVWLCFNKTNQFNNKLMKWQPLEKLLPKKRRNQKEKKIKLNPSNLSTMKMIFQTCSLSEDLHTTKLRFAKDSFSTHC